jgi:glycosyltransferase involved in cell wall biosynthesis
MTRRGHGARIIATDLALAPGARPQRRIRPDEVHPAIAAGDHSLYPTRRPTRLLYSPALRRAAREAVAEADVVHLHSLWLHPQYAGFTAALAGKRPYVISPHGALDPVLRRRGRLRKGLTMLVWQRRMLEGARLIHVTTEVEAELIADIAPGVPRAIVPVGLDVGDFKALPDPSAFRERYLDGYQGPVILFLGRITYKKGIDLLIEAFARLRVELPSRLVIAGPDDEKLTPSLQALAARCNVSKHVSFVGTMFGPDRLAAFASADVWALPSQTENFGVAVVEAMAAGCPVVISRAVNLAPQVAAAQAGVVALELTPSAVARALGSVLGDEARRSTLVSEGLRFAARFDWSAVAPDLEQMYLAAANRAE